MTTSVTSKKPTSDSSDSDSSKLIRDTFSMPDSDYQLIGELLERSPAMAARSTKSEIVRAGLKVLYNMNDKDLSQVLNQVRRLKTGRPVKRRPKSGVNR
jgi:hypothetical protein